MTVINSDQVFTTILT